MSSIAFVIGWTQVLLLNLAYLELNWTLAQLIKYETLLWVLRGERWFRRNLLVRIILPTRLNLWLWEVLRHDWHSERRDKPGIVRRVLHPFANNSTIFTTCIIKVYSSLDRIRALRCARVAENILVLISVFLWLTVSLFGLIVVVNDDVLILIVINLWIFFVLSRRLLLILFTDSFLSEL